MTARTRTRFARATGCALGAALALALIAGSRPAGGEGAVGAEVSVYANRTGELAVTPAGPQKFLHEPALMAGHTASGSFVLTNQTGDRLMIRMAALGSQHSLDDSLGIKISAGGVRLASGTLGELAAAAGKPLPMAPGARRRVEVAVSLPAHSSGTRAAAALVDVAIDFRVRDGVP